MEHCESEAWTESTEFDIHAQRKSQHNVSITSHLLGHLVATISLARVESSMSRNTSTRVAQVTGCLPRPVSHSWRISVFIRSASFKCLCAIIVTLDPFLSSRRKVPNWTYLVAISTGMLTTLPSGQVNFSSSGRVGLVPGLQDV